MFPDKDNFFQNMKVKLTFIFLLWAILGLCCTSASAQVQSQNPEERIRELEKGIQESVDKFADNYKLEDWQIFYVDSIMMHDFKAMDEELQQLQKTKATNTDLYQQIQDKWTEQMYNAFHKVLNEDQWKRYLKNGAERERKNREKREAKRAKNKQK